MWTNSKSVHALNRSLQCSLVFHYVYPDSIYLTVYLLTNVERLVLGCNRSRFLHVNSCWKALDEIYQIYMRPLGEKNRDLHSFAPLESSLETTKSASSKRHPFAPLSAKKFRKVSSRILVTFRRFQNRQHFVMFVVICSETSLTIASPNFASEVRRFLSEFHRFNLSRKCCQFCNAEIQDNRGTFRQELDLRWV